MSQLGKRYRCEDCNTEALCTKAGDGTPTCCDKEMKIQEKYNIPIIDLFYDGTNKPNKMVGPHMFYMGRKAG